MARERPLRLDRRASAVMCGLLIVVGGACGGDGDPTGASDLPPQDVDLQEAVAGARPSAVAIHTGGCGPRTDHGTGAVLDHGLIVTAAHVVAGASEIEVVGASGAQPGVVVLFDPDLDIATLRVARPVGAATDVVDDVAVVADNTPAILGVVDELSTADPRADAHPAGRPATVLRRVTIDTTDITRSYEVHRPGFELAAAVEPGDSGAMVHTADGGIGIVWARSTRRADRAWVVALPGVLLDPDERAALVDPVASGDCP